MAEKAHQNNLQFKPHMKTHQSAEVGQWLREEGVREITVSSVSMARYFAHHGWNDITIAFPANIREIADINVLADQITLTLLVNNKTTAQFLNKHLDSRVKAFVEIDTGAGRTGVKVTDSGAILALVQKIKESKWLQWEGFYSHPGHSYNARSEQDILAVHEDVLKQIQELRKKLESAVGPFTVCIGDTPCCSAGTNFEGIDAISPGNFIFYDLMQCRIGSCEVKEIATAMACPVVDIYPSRGEVTVMGGAVHFSKEMLQEPDRTYYGLPAEFSQEGWQISDGGSYVKALSQEHGVLSCTDNYLNKLSVGDVVHILPVHSCLTANLMGEYTLLQGQKVSQF